MKKFLLFACLSAVLSLFSQNTQQRTCGTPILPQAFESWLQSVTPSPSNGKYSTSSTQSVFNIPVIVHIIHNNEAVNSTSATSGNNLSAAQILDQINILNEDFNGLNADTSLIPSIFKPMLGKFQINFCLAVVNPTGGILAEPGIDRINRVSKGWNAPPYSSTYIDGTIKPNSIWDPNRYLNMWVSALSGGLLGYATFPNPGTSGLSGLTGSFGTATSDGVVMLNTAFGSIGTAAFGAYNQGRTTTHEVGHWVGLRHIWGDGNCATDYVNDTPTAQSSNFGCPGFPYKLGICTGNTTGEMTMNFMDYTNDACMYMFTNDQKIRAQLIMVNSPIRAALATSTVCNLPSTGTDVGITYVARPTFTQTINCYNYIDPILNLKNYGTTTLSSCVVGFNVDGVNTQTISWTGTVTPNTSFTLALPQISGLTNGNHLFNATVTLPNGGTDNNPSNNINNQFFRITNAVNLTVTNASICPGISTVLTASGAVNYTWSNGGGNSSTVSLNPLATTIYTLTASNATCIITKTVSVFVYASPTVAVTNGTACAGIPVQLNASGAVTYTWSTGANSDTVTVAPSNTSNFTVTGSNSEGCRTSVISTVTILNTPTVAVNDLTICPGGTATLTASGASTYSWNTGATTPVIMVSPLTNTTYTITGQIGTCIHTRTVSVNIGSALSVYISPGSPTICKFSALNLTASGANTYTWSNGANSNSIVVSPTINTSYSVTGLAAGCPGTAIITVTVNALPVPNFTTVNTSCFNGSNGQIISSATGNGPFNFNYSSGATGLSAGIFTVTTTDVIGCVVTNTVQINQPTQLGGNFIPGNTSCPASCDGTAAAVLSGGTAPYSYSISPLGPATATNTNMCAGSYTFNFTDANGCKLNFPFTIVQGNIGINVTSTVTNVGCSLCSDATITALPASGTAPYTYTWTPGGFNTAVVNDVAIGCYTVLVTDSLGCTGSSQACVSYDTGIRNLNSSGNKVKVIPNPGNGLFIFQLTEAGEKTITIFDARGRLVKVRHSDEINILIDISGEALGVYYATVKTKETQSVIKVILQ